MNTSANALPTTTHKTQEYLQNNIKSEGMRTKKAMPPTEENVSPQEADDPFYALLFDDWFSPWRNDNELDEDVRKADAMGLSYGYYMLQKRKDDK